MKRFGWILILAVLAAFALVMNIVFPPSKKVHTVVTVADLSDEGLPASHPEDLLNVVSRTKNELVFRKTDGAQLKIGKRYSLELWPTDIDPLNRIYVLVVVVGREFKQNSCHVKLQNFQSLRPYRGWVIKLFEAE
ncbi:MAG: hypothetical protein WAP74_03245 [Patescibacteria group bacterium]